MLSGCAEEGRAGGWWGGLECWEVEHREASELELITQAEEKETGSWGELGMYTWCRA